MKATVKARRQVSKDHFLLQLKFGKKIRAKPGQFVTLPPLASGCWRRPFSIYDISRDGTIISILVKAIGPNTRTYSRLKLHDEIDIFGPKGNPIKIDLRDDSFILVAGDIGMAPLLFLAKQLMEQGKYVNFLLGVKRFADDFLKILKKMSNYQIGQGLVTATDLLVNELARCGGSSTIIACGPVAMLKKVHEIAQANHRKCIVVLEGKMACGGSGNCKSCAVLMKNGTVKHVCKDGPAFKSNKVDWDKIDSSSVQFQGERNPETPAINPLAVTLIGQGGLELVLKSPFMIASGCFDAASKRSETDLLRAGAAVTKGITLHDRAGNRLPRVCEVGYDSMLNSIGLENGGVVKFINEALPYWAGLDLPIIANIVGSTVEEYVEVAQRLAETGLIRVFEINISCPNVKEGGFAFGTDPKWAYEVVKAVREAVRKIFLIAKHTPAAGVRIIEVVLATKDAGADAASLINTFPGLEIDIESGRAVLGAGSGGLSGPAIQPISLWMIREVYESEFGLPIFGVGGFDGGPATVKALLAGATVVQIGTASFCDPQIIPHTCEFVEEYIQRKGFNHISDIVGKMKTNS